MNPLIDLPAHHLESLGWTLIHFCWQAAIIALIYKVADLLITRGSRTTIHTRYLLALAGLLGMFAAAVGTFSYEEVRLHRAVASHYVTSSGTNKIQQIQQPAHAADIFTTDSTSSPILATPEAALPWLDALWMLGVFALSIRTVGGWLLIQRLRATALQQVPPQVAASFTRISHRIGVRGRVALRLSTRIVSPLAVRMFC